MYNGSAFVHIKGRWMDEWMREHGTFQSVLSTESLLYCKAILMSETNLKKHLCITAFQKKQKSKMVLISNFDPYDPVHSSNETLTSISIMAHDPTASIFRLYNRVIMEITGSLCVTLKITCKQSKINVLILTLA